MVMATAVPARSERRTKRDKIIYWTTTGILSAVMVFSIASFTFYDRFPFPDGHEGAFTHLGLPHYFKIELTIAKTLGLLALLVPGVPRKVVEFAYFGFGITLVSATAAHAAVGDASLGVYYLFDPLFFLGLLVVSYRYRDRVIATRR